MALKISMNLNVPLTNNQELPTDLDVERLCPQPIINHQPSAPSLFFPQHHLETLWAPWRVEYFEQNPADTKKDFFTEAAQSSDDAAHFVVTRRKNAFLMLNKYPYSSGHLMVVPYRKTGDMSELSEAEILDLWHLATHAQQLLKAVVYAHGFNIGLNLGSGSGAGVEDHLHLHIVPRWKNDQNFMPLLSGTRVIPEGLRSLYERLIAYQCSSEVHKTSCRTCRQ